VHVVGRDISERKRWENHQRLLVGELNHRVKNTLAIVQSLTHQTFRAGSPPEQSIQAFEGRLQALAAAHNLLTRENWEAASIRDVIDGALRPFCSDARCTVDGPPVRVPPQTAVSLTLTMHELATNASKYGSLSVPEGTIAVRWTVEDERLVLEWVEAGGPVVSPPTRSGFGTRMINRALAADLGGTVSLDYAPEGVRCRIEAPLP
jgi:two-component sensor histidine kinase